MNPLQTRDVVIVIGVVVLVVLFLAILGGAMMGPGMMGWYYGPGYAPWFSVVMLLFWLLVIVGIILLVIWFARQGGQAGPPAERREGTALAILRQRYAKGEISKEQFDQMRRDLE